MSHKSIAGLLLYLLLLQTVHAQNGDAAHPTTLQADDMAMDFTTGIRTYRGNVTLAQGSTRLDCDQLVTYQSNDDTLEKAICNGQPAHLRKQLQDQDGEMKATALEITLYQQEDRVILQNSAKIEQGTTIITGEIINYNFATKQVSVKTDTTRVGQSDEAQAASRPSLTIQPRQQQSE